MDNTKSLVKMLTHRVTALTREAKKLSRMAGASRCERERYNLREASRQAKRKAEMLQARLDRIIDMSPPIQEDIANV